MIQLSKLQSPPAQIQEDDISKLISNLLSKSLSTAAQVFACLPTTTTIAKLWMDSPESCLRSKQMVIWISSMLGMPIPFNLQRNRRGIDLPQETRTMVVLERERRRKPVHHRAINSQKTHFRQGASKDVLGRTRLFGVTIMGCLDPFSCCLPKLFLLQRLQQFFIWQRESFTSHSDLSTSKMFRLANHAKKVTLC